MALWEVVGGAQVGGIVVRESKELTSPEAGRLQTGSLVAETALEGERLQFWRVSGNGPRQGWVSARCKGKDLLQKTTPANDELWKNAEMHRVLQRFAYLRCGPSHSAKVVCLVQRGMVLYGVMERAQGQRWLRVWAGEHRADLPNNLAWCCLDDTPPGAEYKGKTGFEPATFTMKEVDGRGRSLFAARAFEAGEVVLLDWPFFTRPSNKSVTSRKEWTARCTKALSQISEPLVLPKVLEESTSNAPAETARIFASLDMVCNAVGFATAERATQQTLLTLVHPSLEEQHPLIGIAARVAALCIAELPECRGMDPQELQRALLVLEMNAFTGGHLFLTLCLVNHSCSPNIVYVGGQGEGRLQALRRIEKDEELLHSYLGEELLLPTEVRRRHLWRSKCFTCQCQRCCAQADPLREIPCSRCFAELSTWRVVGAETVAVRARHAAASDTIATLSPGQQVLVRRTYSASDWLEVLLPRTEGGSGWVECVAADANKKVQLRQVQDEQDDQITAQLWEMLVPSSGTGNFDEDDALERSDYFDMGGAAAIEAPSELRLPASSLADCVWSGPHMNFEAGVWKCGHCGSAPQSPEELRHAERWLGRLAERTFFRPAMTPAIGLPKLHGFASSGGGVGMVQQAFVARALQLATAATATLGLRHWSVQWSAILLLDLLLTRLSFGLENPLAVNVWVLRACNNLWSWLEAVGLSHPPESFLGSRAWLACKHFKQKSSEPAKRPAPGRSPPKAETEEAKAAAQKAAHQKAELLAQLGELEARLACAGAQPEVLPLRPLIIEGALAGTLFG